MLEIGLQDAFVTLATFSIAFVIYAIIRQNGRRRISDKLSPPCLRSVPILGSFPFIRGGIADLPKTFMEMAETLGPVFHFYAGNKLAVVLNGRKALIDALQKHPEAFGDRDDFWSEAKVNNVNLKGIIFSHYNETFKHTHKITLSILREFGFGATKEIEHRICEEVEVMLKDILEYNGRPFYPQLAFGMVSGKIMLKILYGTKTVSLLDHRKFLEIARDVAVNFETKFDTLPMLRLIPKYRKLYELLVNDHKEMMELLKVAIKHSQADDSEVNFVRRYFEIEESNYDPEHLLYILRDLMLGSADTVSTTLEWAIIELANHPEAQSRLQKEIDEVVPDGRLPSLDDRPNLPYTEAVILESMRIHTLVPFAVQHMTLKDTGACGYHIPKGCLVYPNIYSAHMDPKEWGDPTNFRPERFLDEENNVIGKDRMLGFSLGKRSCIGETLARQQVFLLFASLVQHFDFRPPEGQNTLEVKVVFAVTVRPDTFEMRLIPRKKA